MALSGLNLRVNGLDCGLSLRDKQAVRYVEARRSIATVNDARLGVSRRAYARDEEYQLCLAATLIS